MTSANKSSDGFRVLAFVPAYNEEDIIVPALRHLIDQGLEVYVIENWSTDSTFELASQFIGKGVRAVERFPHAGPSRYHNWKNMLLRIEEIAAESDFDWFLLQGADEIHLSPWPDLNLRDAFLRVDREGFNCINHVVMTFHPIDNNFVPGTSFENYFKHFEYSAEPAHFMVINGWKNLHQPVSLSETGGHETRFPDRRVYPYKFLLKHYQIRSQQHGERKVFRERMPRWDPALKAQGWHVHYDHIVEGDSFLRSPASLNAFADVFARVTRTGTDLPLIDWAAEREKCIHFVQASISAELAAKEVQVRSLSARLLESEIAIEVLTTRTANAETSLQELSKQLADNQDKSAQLSEELNERDDRIEDLISQLVQQEQSLQQFNSQLAVKEAELKQIKSTLGWRVLKLYGKLKYPYLLPFYKLIGRRGARVNTTFKEES